VKLGDAVLATDPETGQSEAKPVTALHTNQDSDLTDLTVTVQGGEDEGEPVTLKTTQHHPFWDVTDGRWVDAADLVPGHELLVYDDTKEQLEAGTVGSGQGGGGPPIRVVVESVNNYAGSKTMHDLTVADIHTYYVITGNTPVLVHNCDSTITGHPDGCGCTVGDNLPPLRKAYIREVRGLSRLGETLRANGASDELTARVLHTQRRIIGEQYKGDTPIEYLEGVIYPRNLEKYGDKLGPTIDYLRGRGKSWEEIIESASRPGGGDLGLGT
jgi:hypothetical protein